MRIGELVEYAIWIDGTETEALLHKWKVDCPYMMAEAHEPRLKLGPIVFEIKYPGEPRVPDVPDHIKGPNVRLLVATAEVIGFESVKRASFVDGLDKRDLKRLRAATRQAHGRNLPDNVCDQIIDRLGPVSGTLH